MKRKRIDEPSFPIVDANLAIEIPSELGRVNDRIQQWTMADRLGQNTLTRKFEPFFQTYRPNLKSERHVFMCTHAESERKSHSCTIAPSCWGSAAYKTKKRRRQTSAPLLKGRRRGQNCSFTTPFPFSIRPIIVPFVAFRVAAASFSETMIAMPMPMLKT